MDFLSLIARISIATLFVLACLAAPVAGQAPMEVTVPVAAISFEPVKFDLIGNADRLERAFRAAQSAGAKIAVAPEGALDGYVVNEIIAGRAPAERMDEVAITTCGAVMDRFQRLARELELCLVFGFAERVGDDIYNAAVFIDHQGRMCGKYHKTQFAEGYDPQWWFNRLGASSHAFDTPYGRCGILICNDRWNPQLARIPVLDGARYLIIPSFGSCAAEQDAAVLSRAWENEVPVIEANVGVTMIVSGGETVAIDRQREGITLATISIPPPTAARPEERDQLEQQFLEWRQAEMELCRRQNSERSTQPSESQNID